MHWDKVADEIRALGGRIVTEESNHVPQRENSAVGGDWRRNHRNLELVVWTRQLILQRNNSNSRRPGLLRAAFVQCDGRR